MEFGGVLLIVFGSFLILFFGLAICVVCFKFNVDDVKLNWGMEFVERFKEVILIGRLVGCNIVLVVWFMVLILCIGLVIWLIVGDVGFKVLKSCELMGNVDFLFGVEMGVFFFFF